MTDTSNSCEHQWEPVPLQFRRFVCTKCQRSGYRAGWGGPIRPHKESRTYKDPRDQTTHVGETHDGKARRGKRGPGGWS